MTPNPVQPDLRALRAAFRDYMLSADGAGSVQPRVVVDLAEAVADAINERPDLCSLPRCGQPSVGVFLRGDGDAEGRMFPVPVSFCERHRVMFHARLATPPSATEPGRIPLVDWAAKLERSATEPAGPAAEEYEWGEPDEYGQISVEMETLTGMTDEIDLLRAKLSAATEPAGLRERIERLDKQWWWEGVMVSQGGPGDERFVGDAATEDDAKRIVRAHNGDIGLLPPTDYSSMPKTIAWPEGLDPERAPFTAEADNAIIRAAQADSVPGGKFLPAELTEIRDALDMWLLCRDGGEATGPTALAEATDDLVRVARLWLADERWSR